MIWAYILKNVLKKSGAGWFTKGAPGFLGSKLNQQGAKNPQCYLLKNPGAHLVNQSAPGFFCRAQTFCILLSISQIQTSTNSRHYILKCGYTFGSAAASDLCGLCGMFMDDIFIPWKYLQMSKNYHQTISQISFLMLFWQKLSKSRLGRLCWIEKIEQSLEVYCKYHVVCQDNVNYRKQKRNHTIVLNT